jgi:hypothetical protein
MRNKWILVSALTAGSLAVGLVACFNPNPADGAFTCTADNDFLCPEGLACNKSTGLCVKTVNNDGGARDALPSFDGTPFVGPRTCEQRVQQGAFSGLVPLSTLNTAGDEHSIAISGSQIYYQTTGGVLMTATVDKKSAGTPTAVTLTNFTGVGELHGGSFTNDGSYWFAGSITGTTSLYQGHKVSATSFTVDLTNDKHSPSVTDCTFLEPMLGDGIASGELYLSYQLNSGGVCDASKNFIVQGFADKNMGTFFGAFNGLGYRAPFLVSDTTMLIGTTAASPSLYYTTRASADVQWTTALPLPMGSIGAAKDQQAVVSSDCSTLYLVSNRSGGAGGLDLWAADIAAQ